MNKEPFSKRFGLAGGLIYDGAPDRLRVRWWYAIKDVLDSVQPGADLAQILVDRLERFLGIPPTLHSLDVRLLMLPEFVRREQPWHKFFDICEATYQLLVNLWESEYSRFFQGYPSYAPQDYENRLNIALEEENIGWRMKWGRFERVGEAAVDKGIEEAHLLLGHDPRLGGPRQQFERAWQCYNRRPQPDVINCVKDAVGAVEATAQVLASKPGEMLDRLIKEWSREGIIPKPLDDMIVKLYAYRGKEPGVAHGETEPSPVSVHEAYLVLGISASLIAYLVNKIR